MKRLTVNLSAVALSAALGIALFAHADALRDPTQPPAAPKGPAAAAPREALPVLSAVMTFNGEHSAIFNGHLVHSGSVVGPYTIDSVLPDGLVYRLANQTHELHLAHAPTTFKKPTAEPARAPSGVP
jgi:hypothetical protein